MATSEIEKLERRYAENPHGLTFAPLAEVHRKNGDVARALELLRVGLELHPNYIPASIVLGRCHQDLGDLPAAADAFAHVLRLDDENVIALKSLADITERQDRLEEAERWLRRLVSVDRSNEEARQQLQRVEAALEKADREVPAPVTGSAVKDASKKVAQPDVRHEMAPVQQAKPETPPKVTAAPPARSEPVEIAPLDLTEDLKKEAADEVLEPSALDNRRPPVLPEPEPRAPPEPAPLAGLETAEFEAPKGPLAPLGGLEIETESDILLNSSGASEFSVPDASQDLAALAAKYNASKPRSPGRRASDLAAAEARDAAAKARETAAAAEPIPPAAAAPPPAVTPPTPVKPAKAYSARDTSGQTIGAFFQALLHARPPGNSGTAQPAPTRSDQDPRTNSGPGSETGSSPASPGGSGKDELVSFDDFFGSGSDRSVTPSGEPGKDDLDQFQSWLQNLKR